MSFLDSSSLDFNGRTNLRRLFYVVSFTTAIEGDTLRFLNNGMSGFTRQVSGLIDRGFLTYRGGSAVNIATVLDEFTTLFSATDVTSGSIVILTGRTSSQSAVTAAANRLVARTGGRVSIAAVALTPLASIATLNSFVSRSVTGSRLVFQSSVLERVPALLTSAISTSGAASALPWQSRNADTLKLSCCFWHKILLIRLLFQTGVEIAQFTEAFFPCGLA